MKLALESGVTMYRRFRRWIPATESGHGRSRHQTRASPSISSVRDG
jgi:hypothetical protein